MELLLFAVIFLQLIYIAFSDMRNMKEREDLQMKLMAKDLSDYKSATEETPEPAPSIEEDPYLTIEEAGVERVVAAKEK